MQSPLCSREMTTAHSRYSKRGKQSENAMSFRPLILLRFETRGASKIVWGMSSQWTLWRVRYALEHFWLVLGSVMWSG